MSTDYERIASAISFIRTHVNDQPSLADVAAQVHLSESHFQRLFCRWAGVTPKRYLQALTLSRAKRMLLTKDISSLNVSYELGLSSGSRLYDHFVQIEAVTPSEYRNKGEGLTIVCGFHQTPYGLAFLAQTARGICQLDFVEPASEETLLNDLRKTWCNAEIMMDDAQTAPVITLLFSRQPHDTTPLSLWVRGTNFQLNVWRALLKLQPGDVASYRDIAHAIGSPKASRAVGSAIGANPVGLIIPCHRVLRQTGELGGYRWGEIRKHAILAREAAAYV